MDTTAETTHLVPLTLREMIAAQAVIKQRLDTMGKRRAGQAAWSEPDEDVWQRLHSVLGKFRSIRKHTPFAARGGRQDAARMTEHSYPSNYKPGPEQHWAINEAWDVLDMLTPGVLSFDARCFLGGMIAGALLKAYHAGLNAAEEARALDSDRA